MLSEFLSQLRIFAFSNPIKGDEMLGSAYGLPGSQTLV